MEYFTEIVTKLEVLREEQRMSIVNHLDSIGVKVSKHPSSGKGRSNYTAGGTIAEYDLRNWKYIDASKDGKGVFISLQAFDQDPRSRNHHVLENRIGIYTYTKYDPEDAFRNMFITDIDLPMNEAKFAMLDDAIEAQLRKAK